MINVLSNKGWARFLSLVIFVTSFNYIGIVQSQVSQAGTYSGPEAPLDITQSSSASGITLSWTKPSNIGAGGNYVIEKSTNGTTWSSVGTAVGTTSYTITSGLTTSTSYFFRVAAIWGGVQGAFGYPWTEIYRTSSANRNVSGGINYVSGYGLGGSDAAQTYINGTGSTAFSRVRYRIESTVNTVSRYSDVNFEKWTAANRNTATGSNFDPTITYLRIPSLASGDQITVHANISDLTILTNSPDVRSGFGLSGRLEIWPWDYQTNLSGLSPSGNATNYDYDDTPNGGGSYGSFQVHTLEDFEPAFVWNRHAAGQNAEVGYGNASSGHPDWTFCGNSAGVCTPSAFKLSVFVNPPITTAASITPAISSAPTISGTTTFGQILTASTGSWDNTPTSYIYQWSRASTSGGSYSNISGATNSTYTLVAADVSQYLKVTVTATNTSGSASAISAATSIINKATPAFSSWSNVSKTYGDTAYTVTAPTVVGSIAGTFAYSSDSASVISVSASTFTVQGAGSAIITATFTPTDSANYNSATTSHVVTVSKASQTGISITSTAGSYGTPLNVTTSGGSGSGAISYSYAAGTTTCLLSSGVLTANGAGTCLITATKAADNNYNSVASSQTTITFAVGSTSATITLAPGTLSYRTAKNISATASVAGKITFRANNVVISGCKGLVVNSGNSFTRTCPYRPSSRGSVTITVTLTPTDVSYSSSISRSANYFIDQRSGTR